MINCDHTLLLGPFVSLLNCCNSYGRQLYRSKDRSFAGNEQCDYNKFSYDKQLKNVSAVVSSRDVLHINLHLYY